ncbi:hypothetical protein VPH35_099472 [Triticum aestivum]|uniref:uncharacterized protein isoform X1 n=1 Tax=Triticum aestivum TaxID=4565 RepID=UPI000843C420|nr:uncharacterized protein LOC123122562 isoform X1 [Triticum aestivum]XP_044398703.1 uncharacterized protein LOC123122562 isoform X1 [Triticum aestivum]
MPLDDMFAESGDQFNFDGFHLLCSDEKPSSFGVVCVLGDVTKVRAAVFSSETWEWVVHPWVDIGAERKLRFRSGMLVGSSIYWPYNWLVSNGDEGEGYVVKLDTVTMDFSFVDLPLKVQGYNFKIGDTEDGELCIVYALDSLLHVWTRRADDDGGIERWVPHKTFSLIEDIGWITETLRGMYTGLEVLEVRAGCVYMATKHSSPCRWFFSLSLDTMEIERLFQGRCDGQAYPYIMAWPPLVGDHGSIGHDGVEGSQ